MFAIPITILHRTDESITPLLATVEIDKIVAVKSLLDILPQHGVESDQLYSLVPHAELLMECGRRIPIIEPDTDILRYLDAYRQMDEFFSRPKPVAEPTKGGVVLQLFQGGKCATSEGSIPA